MKKIFLFSMSIIFSASILIGCSKKQEENVSIEIWHYYNGAHKIAFDQLVMDFNETIGLEKGIIVEAFNQGDINNLQDKIIESVEEKVGASKLPNVLTAYSEIAYTLDQREILVDLEDYISNQEINEYIDSYIEEGRLGKGNKLKIFPIAKATEIMMVNKTDWDKFSKATGATINRLATWEGVRKTAELYYNWTDSLTEEENDGKAFFGRDALANYMIIGSKQLEKEIFHVDKGKVIVDIDKDAMRQLWDNYYIPYISGYYASYGRFSTDDAKIGEIIALVGSTTGAVYFPDKVTIGDKDSYNIELLALPVPNFKNTKPHAVQQGAGMVVLKSDQAHEQASVEFLKWFTEASRNLGFSIETGYLPVKKEAYEIAEAEDGFKQEIEKAPKQIQISFPVATGQMEEYDLYVNKAFENSSKARGVLESALETKAKVGREQVKELISQGMSHQEAVENFSTDQDFYDWLYKFGKNLREVVEP